MTKFLDFSYLFLSSHKFVCGLLKLYCFIKKCVADFEWFAQS